MGLSNNQETAVSGKVTRQELIDLVFDAYSVEADYPFRMDDVSCVFRHPDSKKWFALMMNIPYRTLGIARDGNADILNVKCEPVMGGSLRRQPGFFPAYHMSKDRWLTVLLDGTVSREEIGALLALSWELTAARGPRPRKRKNGGET